MNEPTPLAQSLVLCLDEHETVTEFRGLSPPPGSSLESNDHTIEGSCSDGNNLKSVSFQEDDLNSHEIPFAKCFSGIVEVLERFKKKAELEDAMKVHGKLTHFISTMVSAVEISAAESDHILYALEKGPYLVEIMVGNSLYMGKILSIFRNDQPQNPIIVKNNFALLTKMKHIVLEKLCFKKTTEDWDESEPAVDFLLAFTRNTLSMKWFLNHLDHSQVSTFLEQLIVEFYCRSEFSVIVAEWLQSTNLIEELVERFQHINSPYDNIAALLEGLFEFCRIHRRTRGTNLVSQLFSLDLISLMLTSLLTLLKEPSSNARDDGVIQGFRILGRLLRLDDQKSSTQKKEYVRNAIVIVTENKEFMEAIYNVLRLGGPKIYFKLTSKGTSPLGRVRRAVLGFVHDMVDNADRKALKTILEQPTLEYLIKYLFWLQPLNSFVHLKVRSIITALLRSNIRKAADMSNFLEAAIEFLKKPNPPGQQRAHIMRIISVWVNYRNTSVVKDAMDKWTETHPNLQSECEHLVSKDLQTYLRKQGTLLGGVPKPTRKSPERVLSR